MVGVAEIRILATHARPERCELCVNKSPDESDSAADDPRPEHQPRGVNLAGDDTRIHEDAGADDPAHHDHRGVEGTEPPGECRLARRVRRHEGTRRSALLRAGHGALAYRHPDARARAEHPWRCPWRCTWRRP